MEKIDVVFGRPVQCMDCGRTTLFDDKLPPGWIAEAWDTEGGQEMAIVRCFGCRHLLDWELYRTPSMIGAWL